MKSRRTYRRERIAIVDRTDETPAARLSAAMLVLQEHNYQAYLGIVTAAEVAAEHSRRSPNGAN